MGAEIVVIAKIIYHGAKLAWALAPWYAKAAIFAVASYGLHRYTVNKMDMPDNFMGSEVSTQGGTAPVVIAYGETVSPGHIADVRIDNNDAEDVWDLHMFFLHSFRNPAGGRPGITKVLGWYLNDDYVENRFSATDPTAPIGTHGIQNGGPWDVDTGLTKAVFVKAGRGNQVTTPGESGYSDRPHLLGETFRQWRTGASPTSEMIGAATGFSYTHWRFRRHKDSAKLFSNGQPRLRQHEQGCAVYDPRKDSTRGGSGSHRLDNPNTWEYSDNPALAYADYRTQYTRTPLRRLEWETIIEAANFCDELVPVPGGTMEKRYTCNVRLSGANAHKDNIKIILDSFNGRQVYSSGKYSLILPKAGEPVLSLDDSNVIGQVEFISDRNITDEVTRVLGKFRDKASMFLEKDFPSREKPLPEGQAHRDYTMSLPAVNTNTQCQRLADNIIEQQRMEEHVMLPLNYVGLRLTVGSRFNLTLPLLGYTVPKKFRVFQLSFGVKDVPVAVSAIEDEDDIWGDLAANEYHVVDPSERITRAEQAPFAPTEFTAMPTLLPGQIEWRWTLPGIFDSIQLYTSRTANWDDAELTWEGSGSRYVQSLDEVDTLAQRTRYGWVRTILSGLSSIRNPDDDVSSVQGVALSGLTFVGTDFLFGIGPPTADIGKIGDIYLDINTSRVYKKLTDTMWRLQYTLDLLGTTWLTGARDPLPSDGENGNFWLNTVTGDYFEKSMDVWMLVGNLKGADGRYLESVYALTAEPRPPANIDLSRETETANAIATTDDFVPNEQGYTVYDGDRPPMTTPALPYRWIAYRRFMREARRWAAFGNWVDNLLPGEDGMPGWFGTGPKLRYSGRKGSVDGVDDPGDWFIGTDRNTSVSTTGTNREKWKSVIENTRFIALTDRDDNNLARYLTRDVQTDQLVGWYVSPHQWIDWDIRVKTIESYEWTNAQMVTRTLMRIVLEVLNVESRTPVEDADIAFPTASGDVFWYFSASASGDDPVTVSSDGPATFSGVAGDWIPNNAQTVRAEWLYGGRLVKWAEQDFSIPNNQGRISIDADIPPDGTSDDFRTGGDGEGEVTIKQTSPFSTARQRFRVVSYQGVEVRLAAVIAEQGSPGTRSGQAYRRLGTRPIRPSDGATVFPSEWSTRIPGGSDNLWGLWWQEVLVGTEAQFFFGPVVDLSDSVLTPADLQPPRNLRANERRARGLDMRFAAATSGALARGYEYRYRRNVGGAQYTGYSRTGITETGDGEFEFTISGLLQGSSYLVQVRAYTQTAQSPASTATVSTLTAAEGRFRIELEHPTGVDAGSGAIGLVANVLGTATGPITNWRWSRVPNGVGAVADAGATADGGRAGSYTPPANVADGIEVTVTVMATRGGETATTSIILEVRSTTLLPPGPTGLPNIIRATVGLLEFNFNPSTTGGPVDGYEYQVSATPPGVSHSLPVIPSHTAWVGSTLYAVVNRRLATLDFVAGTVTYIGPPGFGVLGSTDVRDMVWDGSTLWVTEGIGLYAIDRTTGLSTSSVGSGRVVNSVVYDKLAWDGSTLYAADPGRDAALYTIDRATGEPTRVGSSERFGIQDFAGGLEWDGSTLYMTGATTFALYILDRTTGVATRVGSAVGFGTSQLHFAPQIAWDGSTLYMFSPPYIYALDRSTGVATRFAALPLIIGDATAATRVVIENAPQLSALDVSHEVQVRAFNQAGHSAWARQSFSLDPVAPVLGAVSNLRIAEKTETTISAVWSHLDGAQRYDVRIRAGTLDFSGNRGNQLWENFVANDARYEFTELAGTEFVIGVRPIRSDGRVGLWAYVEATVMRAVETTQRNEIVYQVGSSNNRPATPRGGEDIANHVPDGWGAALPNSGHWRSMRTATYAGSDFVRASAWSVPFYQGRDIATPLSVVGSFSGTTEIRSIELPVVGATTVPAIVDIAATATGGTAPYTYSGDVGRFVLYQPGFYTFTVQVTDADGHVATDTVSVNVTVGTAE